MAELIPRDFIDQVLSRTDIVSLVDHYVPLKKMGANYKACCPFHNEKSPSFVVSSEKQIYHCFGCGVGGNAISFLMEYEHQSFVEAIKSLAKRLNLIVPTTQQQTSQRYKKVDDLYDVMGLAVAFYQQQLREHAQAEKAKSYLINRGLTGQIAKQYSLGFAPKGWDNLQKGLSGKCQASAMKQTGLTTSKEGSQSSYDRFRDRIIFPIRDRQGRYVALGGRIIDEGEPKYLNSPETPIFHKSKELYGFYELLQVARSPEYIVIVEGYMDVLALVQHGVTNVVGTLGTATTAQHVSTLFRYTDELVFCFDGDEAGRKAAWRALQLLLPVHQDGKALRFMFLPDGEDPDSFVRAQGEAGFKQAMKSADTLTEFFLSHLCEQVNLSLPDGRAKLIKLAKEHLTKMAQSHLKQILINEIAARAKVPLSQLQSAFNQQEDATEQFIQKSQTRTPLRHALSILLQHPALAKEVSYLAPAQPDAGQQFLVDLLAFIGEHHDISTAGLLEHWRSHVGFKQLLALANQPLLIQGEGLKAELVDTIKHLEQQEQAGRVEQLMSKASKDGLSMAEKQELQELLG